MKCSEKFTQASMRKIHSFSATLNTNLQNFDYHLIFWSFLYDFIILKSFSILI